MIKRLQYRRYQYLLLLRQPYQYYKRQNSQRAEDEEDEAR